MEEKDISFFAQFTDGKNIFLNIFRKAKKGIVLEDEDTFKESIKEVLTQNHKLSIDNAEKYAQMILDIWEDCGCSLTIFDRQMSKYKTQLF